MVVTHCEHHPCHTQHCDQAPCSAYDGILEPTIHCQDANLFHCEMLNHLVFNLFHLTILSCMNVKELHFTKSKVSF